MSRLSGAQDSLCLSELQYLSQLRGFPNGYGGLRVSHTAETGRGTARHGLDTDLRFPVDPPQTIERPGPEPGLWCHLVAKFGIATGSDVRFQGCDFLFSSIYLFIS